MSERLFKNVEACQDMIVEALKYHLLPDRRQLMYSRRTQPRKSYLGQLFAFGTNDSGKLLVCADVIVSYSFLRRGRGAEYCDQSVCVCMCVCVCVNSQRWSYCLQWVLEGILTPGRSLMS